MRKLILLTTTLVSILSANAQTWSKLSTNFDSLWTSSVKYFNKGDTLSITVVQLELVLLMQKDFTSQQTEGRLSQETSQL